jgi:hypothetical protein
MSQMNNLNNIVNDNFKNNIYIGRSTLNIVGLPSKIIPYAERFYKLSNKAQEMVLHYGDNIEEGFNTACRLEIELCDRHSAAFLDNYRMYGEVSDFYWKTKLVTTPYQP